MSEQFATQFTEPAKEPVIADDNSAALETEVGELKGQLQAMKDEQARTQQMFQHINSRVDEGLQRQEPVDNEPEIKMPTDEDFDMMSQAQVSAHITDNVVRVVGKQVADALKPISERLDTMSTDFHNTSAKSTLTDARAKHKDFDAWGDEIRAQLENQRVPDLEGAYA